MKYFLIGIKGSGMSALALLLLDRGFEVEGSDYDKYFFTEDELIKRNVLIKKQSKENIKEGKIYIYSSAYKDKEEVKRAKELNLEIYEYHEFIGTLKYNNLIAISGTHGKTTTATLVKDIFCINNNVDYIIGDGSGKGNSVSDTLILEACEYQNHFHNYNPNILLINNIDYDHPDFFKDKNEYYNSFYHMVERSNIVIVNGDLEETSRINGSNVIKFGFKKENDYVIGLVDEKQKIYSLTTNEKRLYYRIPFFGKHMIYNTIASIVIAKISNISDRDIYKAINNYVSPRRRMEEIIINNTIFIDDYAHHPTEITASINAIREKHPNRKIILLFQPHTLSRTKAYKNEFASALNLADEVYILDIYTSVREIDPGEKDILMNIIPNSKAFDETFNPIEYKNCVIVTMGAGDVNKYFNCFINIFKKTILEICNNNYSSL